MRYAINGKQRIVKLGSFVDLELQAARAMALEWRKQVHEGVDPKYFRRAKDELVVQTLVDEYTATKRFKTRSSDYQHNFNSTARRYILPALGNQSVHTVKRAQIRDMLNDLISQGKEGSARGLHTMTRVLFNYAIKEEMLETNPADRIQPMYTSDGVRRVKFSEDLIREAWDLSIPEQSQALVRWLLATGNRRDTGRLLKWEDIYERSVSVEKTKNGRPLSLPITHMMGFILADQRDRFPGSDWVFPSTTSRKKPLPRPTFDYQVRMATKGRWSVHHLRHLVETGMADLMVSEEIRDAVLGHVRKSTGARYNSARMLKMKQHGLDTWQNGLARIIAGRRLEVDSDEGVDWQSL